MIRPHPSPTSFKYLPLSEIDAAQHEDKGLVNTFFPDISRNNTIHGIHEVVYSHY